MAITFGFFNSVNGDRKYNAAQIGRYLQHLVSSGVYAYASDSLQVLANDGMEVQVQAGRAMLDHHFMENDAPITLTLAAGGSQDRVDAVVMYVDITERACGITVKQGTPGATPKAPAMTRTDVRKEYQLAAVRVPKLSSAITQANITDTRADSTVCGWVTGLIKQVDTSTLFLQWQAAYEEAYAELGDYLAAQKAAWDAFFTAVSEDNLVPVPNVDAIGGAVVVNDTGDGYVLRVPDRTLTAQGAAADAAAVGLALTVPNLLDNSDFTNPFNGNGALVYTGSKETLTKWISRSGYSVVTIAEDCVNIKSSNGTTTAYVLQFLEDGKIKSGKIYTVACELKDGSKHCISAVASESMTEATRYIYVDGAQLGTIRMRYDTSEKRYAVMFSTLSTSGLDIANTALYEGEYTAETLPVYRPRGYAIEAVICGGGAGLNFSVVGGTTQPTNPNENTIWVNTSEPITSYVFSAVRPAATAGMVWINTGVSSAVEFNALKKNGIQVCPLSAKQYISGAWVDKTARSYQRGAWADWWNGVYLFNEGDSCTSVTGGWVSVDTMSQNYATADGVSTVGNTLTVTTTNSAGSTNRQSALTTSKTIDVSGHDTMKIVVDSVTPGEFAGARYCCFGLSSDKKAHTIAKEVTAAGELSMDISAASGSFYPFIQISNGERAMIVSKIWLE